MEFRVTTGLPVEGYVAPKENIQVFEQIRDVIGTPGLGSGFNPETGKFDKPVISAPQGKSKFKMGLGSFVKKIVKAPVKAVKAVGKGVAPLGSAIIDTGSKAVKGTAQVPEDIYSGVKKGVGSVGRGVEKIGAGFTEGASELVSDPIVLGAAAAGFGGAIPASQAFTYAAGGLALKSLGSSGAFVSPSGEVITINPNTGQPNIIQQPMRLPGYQPSQFQSNRSGNDDQSAFDFTALLPLVAIGAVGLYFFRGRK